MTASSATGAAAFSTGIDSPVSAASSTIRLRSSDEPHVGRHLVAGLQEHDVARDELGRGQRALAPFRITIASSGAIALNALIALLARYS